MRRVIAGTTTAVIAVLMTPGVAASQRPCYPTYCSHSLTVGQTPAHWATPKVRKLDRLEARFRGRLLGYWNQGCVSFAQGYGITVKFNGCGAGAQPVRVTATSLRNSPVRVRIIYG